MIRVPNNQAIFYETLRGLGLSAIADPDLGKEVILRVIFGSEISLDAIDGVGEGSSDEIYLKSEMREFVTKEIAYGIVKLQKALEKIDV